MRLWSIHPKYLDSKGLVALWREGLLAQRVLLGKTEGYLNHPQLKRFKETNNAQGAIASYLRAVAAEADHRGYRFNTEKIVNRRYTKKIPVTDQQLTYEFNHLLKKLKVRDANLYQQLKHIGDIELHPLFTQIKGAVAEWEILKNR